MTKREQEIDNFIKRFSQYGKPARKMFTEGNCYWFAIILAERFKAQSPTIRYVPELYHFITEIGGRYYDITGNVTKQYPEAARWDTVQKETPKKAEKITEEIII